MPPELARGGEGGQLIYDSGMEGHWIWLVPLGLGGFVCILNFHLSFLRFFLHRMRGRGRDEYRWVSGFPLVGSLLVAVSLVGLWEEPWLRIAAFGLILIDTGGPHWFLLSQVLDRWCSPSKGDGEP
jgi:hypothetical protein